MSIKDDIRARLRSWIVDKSFAVPQVRGVHRLAILLGDALTNKTNNVTIGTLKNGYAIKLDLKSPDQHSLFYLRSYEDDLVGFFRSLLSEERPVFIDIGASLGVFSLSVVDLIKNAGGRIVAFEPFQANYDFLAESIKLNHVEDRVKLYRRAVGNENRPVQMRIDETKARTGNALMRDVDPHGSSAYEECEMVVLDEFLSHEYLEKITAVKIDIEGWEYFALKGFTKMIKQFHPIIYGEFLQSGMRAAGITIEMIEEIISEIEYVPHVLQGGQLVLVHELPSSERLDLILIPKA